MASPSVCRPSPGRCNLRPLALIAPALLALVLTAGASADTVMVKEMRYEWKRGEERSYTARHQHYLAPSRGRLEQENEVYLIDTAAGEFHYLDLDLEHVQSYPSPNTYENRTPPALVDRVLAIVEERRPQPIEVTRSGESERIAGYEAERVVIDAGGPGEPMTGHFELWVSRRLWDELADTVYWQLERDRLSTSLYTVWLVDILRELEAVPVKTRISMSIGDGDLRTEFTQRLVSVETGVEVPEALYRVSEGFTPFPDPAPAAGP